MKRTKMNLAEKMGNNDIFSYMTDAPWSVAGSAPADINLMLLSTFGTAKVSRAVDLVSAGDVLTPAETERLADLILQKYREQWNRLFKTLSLSYEPIENYDRREETTDQRKNTGTQKINDNTETTNTYGRTNEQLDTRTETHSGTNTTETESNNSRFGFDSDAATPVEKNVGTMTERPGELITNGGGIKSTDGGNDSQRAVKTNTRTDDLTEDYTHTSRIHGNIGVTTSQQMLQSEIDLWGKWNFWDFIVKDVGKFLTIPYRGGI